MSQNVSKCYSMRHTVYSGLHSIKTNLGEAFFYRDEVYIRIKVVKRKS